jgi:hypothetical protein
MDLIIIMQDFNPDDFYNMEEGMDKSQLAGLMTSSSHVPYILSRLNMSISSNTEEGVWVGEGCGVAWRK